MISNNLFSACCVIILTFAALLDTIQITTLSLITALSTVFFTTAITTLFLVTAVIDLFFTTVITTLIHIQWIRR